mgnify:CR=1 FL=1
MNPWIILRLLNRKKLMDWTPNPLWQQLSSTAEDNTFSALHAVYPLSPNWCTLQFTMSAGQYTVAWGDSTTENVNSGVTAYKSFGYDSCPDNDIGKADEVACTFTDSGDTVNITGHQFVNGNLVSFSNVKTTTGISAGSLYYVVNSATNTFKVSNTIGGAAVSLTNDGSGKIYIPKYRTVVVNVTPTTGGASFTAFNLSVRHTSATAVTYSTQWLDVAINAQGCTTQTMYSANVTHANMERFQGDLRLVTNFTNFLLNCYSLTSVPLLNTAAGTSFAGMFQNCYSLTSVPLLNTAAGTNFTSMFQNCYSLVRLPALRTNSGTDFTTMLGGCKSLASAPFVGTAQDINYASTQLSATELNRIYSQLATAAKTITITGCYGATGDDPSIATGKGWTVVG